MNHTLLLTNTGDIYAFGDGSNHQVIPELTETALTQDESKSSGHDNSKKQTKSGKHLSLGTTKGKVILGLSILLVILIITFIATVFRIRKKSNKRKTNKRKKQ